MKKILYTSILTLLSFNLFSQLQNGKYSYKSNEVILNFTITGENGEIIKNCFLEFIPRARPNKNGEGDYSTNDNTKSSYIGSYTIRGTFDYQINIKKGNEVINLAQSIVRLKNTNLNLIEFIPE